MNRNLRGILKGLPKTLDETYERVLKDINEDNRKHARRLLHCLAVSIRPLRVQELAEILAFDFDGVEGSIPEFRADWRPKDQEWAVLSTCSSLITVVDSYIDSFGNCRVVQFSHFSVKEFLTSDRLASTAGDVSQYHIIPGPAHTILAQACLGFLLHLDIPTDLDTSKRFPLTSYADEHCITHAKFEDVASHVKDGLQSLFDPDKHHLVAWLGINNNLKDFHHLFPMNTLYFAAYFGFYDIVRHLVISHPRLINTVCGRYSFPVLAALNRKHIEVAEFLLQQGGRVDILGTEGLTLLQMSINLDCFERGDMVHAVSFLLSHDADVNFRGSDLSTPLHHATTGDSEIVELLLESGADTNSLDDKGRSPLHMTLTQGDEAQIRDITQLLLEFGANVNTQDNAGATPLLEAAYRCYVDISQILLQYNACPNVANNDGKTPLHLVFEHNFFCSAIEAEIRTARVVRLLLERRAAVNALDKDKTTPLFLAIKRKMYDITSVLLVCGAEPNVKNDAGKTPLHLLLEDSFPNDDYIPGLTHALLYRGADVNAQDQNNATPLLLATERHLDVIARILLEHGADPNVKNSLGKTPLHLLLERRFHDQDDINDILVVERLLLECGADVNAQDEDKTTPLHLLYHHRRSEIAQIILDGANAEKDRDQAQSYITLEGENNFRKQVWMSHGFIRSHRICEHAEPRPHNPPTLGMLFREA